MVPDDDKAADTGLQAWLSRAYSERLGGLSLGDAQSVAKELLDDRTVSAAAAAAADSVDDLLYRLVEATRADVLAELAWGDSVDSLRQFHAQRFKDGDVTWHKSFDAHIARMEVKRQALRRSRASVPPSVNDQAGALFASCFSSDSDGEGVGDSGGAASPGATAARKVAVGWGDTDAATVKEARDLFASCFSSDDDDDAGATGESKS